MLFEFQCSTLMHITVHFNYINSYFKRTFFKKNIIAMEYQLNYIFFKAMNIDVLFETE